jgi:hypothetical protein
MKSEVFNGKRFFTYFKYDLMQTLRIHVKAAILIGFAGVIFYLLGIAFNAIAHNVWQAPGFSGRVVIFILSCIALELYQIRTYGYITERRKGSSWLLVPASAFEKWLSMILMTLLVIPVSFIVTYSATDAILSLADPTYGKMLLSSAVEVFGQFQTSLAAANEQYTTSWNLSFMIVPYLVGFCCNFLYFLFCGVTFKRYKLLYAFLILFGISIVTSTVTAWLGIQNNIELEDFAEAEQFIRHTISVVTVYVGAFAILLAGGIFYRIKTLKH